MNFIEWIKYHFFVWLIPKPQGKTGDADFVCPQAFGRNTWTDEEIAEEMAKLFNDLGGSRDQDRAMEKLAEINFDPGIVNIFLARECYTLAKELKRNGKKPWIIGQWEVIFALIATEREWYKQNRFFIIAILPKLSGEYLGTRGLLFEAKEIARSFGLKHPVIVGQAEHLARCVELAKRVFGEDRIVVPRVDDVMKEYSFDPFSKQPQTTGKLVWRWYEFRARWHHLLHGWAP